jgi:hypothetical protein
MVMRPTRLRRTGVVAVAGGLLLVSGIPPLTFGSSKVSVLGDLAEPTQPDPGAMTAIGETVDPVDGWGDAMRKYIPIGVWGGQKISLVIGFRSPLSPLPRCGIIVDDGAPI